MGYDKSPEFWGWIVTIVLNFGSGLGQMSNLLWRWVGTIVQHLAAGWDKCPEFWRWIGTIVLNFGGGLGQMTNLLCFCIIKVSCRPAAADAAGKKCVPDLSATKKTG